MNRRKRDTPLTPVVITTEECTLDMKQRIIAALPLLQDLSSGELQDVHPVFRELGFAAGEHVNAAQLGASGTPGERGLYVVGAGLVKLLRTDYEGREVVLDFLVTGEIFGSAVGAAEGDLTVAHTAACVFFVDESPLQDLFRRHPEVASRLIELTALRVQHLHERLHLLSGAPARSRVVAALQRLGEKLGKATRDGLLLEIPLSRDDLASLCGTTPETASRVVSALQREGHLKTGRRWITLAETFRQIPGLD